MVVRNQVHRQIRERRSSGGKGEHAVRALAAVGLREDVARSDVEDEAREDAQIDEERVRRKREKQRGDGSGDRCQSVCQQERLGTLFSVLMGEHERYRVHAVGKSVRYDCHRHHYADGRIDLETQTDADAVKKAVSDERRRRKRSDVGMVVVRVVLFVVMVDEYRLFQEMECEKTHRERDHGVRRFETVFVRKFEDLGQDFESGDTEKYARRERHDEMQAVFELERNESAQKDRDEGDSGKYGGIKVHIAKNDDKRDCTDIFPMSRQFVRSRGC